MNLTPLQAGEGIADISPPVGVELAGFHKPVGQERRTKGIRQPTAARALVLKTGKTTAAIVSLEVLGFSREFAQSVQKQVARKTRIPANHVRVCATHTHSAPSLMFLRQWGAMSKDYNDTVLQRAVEAVIAAEKDLAPADFYLGKQSVVGANFNRTSKQWKTDDEFDASASDSARWLDRQLIALYFLREKPKPNLLWYNFSAHPVCYTDELAGPDWPGLVAIKTEERDGLRPAYLQANCGDVNPGDGDPWLGVPEEVSEAVWTALHHATNHSTHIPVEEIEAASTEIKIPLDIERLKNELDTYRKDPAACTKGEWVDAGFAKDWFEDLSKWKMNQTTYTSSLSAMRLGSVALLFHSAELYSYYGLAIRRDSPFAETVVVGYADDVVGYVTDPKAYENKEYAAIVVPKLIGLPPFKPEAGRFLAAEANKLLRKLAKV